MTTFAPTNVTEARRAAAPPYSERTASRSLPSRLRAWMTAIGLAHASRVFGPESVYGSAASESLRLALLDDAHHNREDHRG